MSLFRRGAVANSIGGLKIKRLTGTTGASEGSSVDVAHGLTMAKIIGWTSRVVLDTDTSISDGFTASVGSEFNAFVFTDTNMRVSLHATNSENILSKAFEIIVFYVD